ncbi:MAG: 30S ribosomal protein S2, partial [Leucobacter sp.]|nr:30S ribosomal protein S2 [Leucobacter sp.]
RSVALLTRVIADAAAEGLMERHQKPAEGEAAAEPLAEWEVALLNADAAEAPAAEAPAAEATEAPAAEAPAAEATEAPAAEAAETPAAE